MSLYNQIRNFMFIIYEMNSDSILVGAEKSPKVFRSVVGIIFSCLGCVVGTGNIWRFPRIVARNSGENGAAAFFLIWLICLFTWSIPLMVIEYTLGRHTRVAPIRCFYHFMGKKGIVFGGWITLVIFFIGSYYTVIIGWCVYYIILPMKMELPSDEATSQQLFNSFIESNWSFIPYSLSFVFMAACVIGGINIIEKVNIVLVPLLLAILLGIFFYSTTFAYSDYGFSFLFSVDWKSLAKPSLYLDAISQNAFDTSAGCGLITAYAMYITESNSIMRYSLFIPLLNNGVSFLASMTIFPTVYGLMITKTPTITQTGILAIIKGGGLAGTGLTFIWIPILLETMGGLGRFICSIFFLCLSFAGISSVISAMELQIITLEEFGISRKLSVLITSASMFLFGAASVLQIKFLNNQDSVWGFSLIVSGLMYISLVIVFGPLKFRSKIVNERKFKNDFNLPYLWVFIIVFIAPLQAVTLLVWWVYSEIKTDINTWYIPGWTSLITTWIEWILLGLILLIATATVTKLNKKWINKNNSFDDKKIQTFNAEYRNNQIKDIRPQYVSYIESDCDGVVSEAQQPYSDYVHLNDTSQREHSKNNETSYL